jgi:hypothetical protein
VLLQVRGDLVDDYDVKFCDAPLTAEAAPTDAFDRTRDDGVSSAVRQVQKTTLIVAVRVLSEVYGGKAAR